MARSRTREWRRQVPHFGEVVITLGDGLWMVFAVILIGFNALTIATTPPTLLTWGSSGMVILGGIGLVYITFHHGRRRVLYERQREALDSHENR